MPLPTPPAAAALLLPAAPVATSIAASLAPIALSCLLVSLASAASESRSAASAHAWEAKASITTFCCCNCCFESLSSSPCSSLLSENRTRSSLGGGFLLVAAAGGGTAAAAAGAAAAATCFLPRKSFGVGRAAVEVEVESLMGEVGAEACLCFRSLPSSW